MNQECFNKSHKKQEISKYIQNPRQKGKGVCWEVSKGVYKQLKVHPQVEP